MYGGHLAINHENLLPHQLLKPTSISTYSCYTYIRFSAQPAINAMILNHHANNFAYTHRNKAPTQTHRNPKSARGYKRTRHLLRNQMVLGNRHHIPTNREPRSHRHNPKDNLPNSRPNTPNGEHRRTPRHNQRKTTTRLLSSQNPFSLFPIF